MPENLAGTCPNCGEEQLEAQGGKFICPTCGPIEKKKGLWRPKDPKAVSLIKMCCWSGITVWMIFFFAYSVIAAQRLGEWGPYIFGLTMWGKVLTWVTPIWVVFTSLLVVIYVARFVNKKFGVKK